MIKYFLFFLIIFISFFRANFAFSQSANSPLDADRIHFIDRLEIKSNRLSNNFHSNIKPFTRQDLAKFLDKIDTLSFFKKNKVDFQNLIYLKNDNWEFLEKDSITIDSSNISKRPILKYIYKNKTDFYYTETEDYDLHVSPIVNFGFGKNSTYGILPAKSMFINTRGVEIRGSINQKLGFYTMITENQVSSPNFVVNYYKNNTAIPYQSWVKIIDDDYQKLTADYFNAVGYFAFRPVKNINMMFGHDRNFIGSGIRSMVLGDFSSPYLQLKTDLKIGRLQYFNIIGQLINRQVFAPLNSTVTYPPKYLAFHHLNVNVAKNLNIGLFESVMFGNRNSGFELNYLNPIIFYRFIEGYLGSTDNALVGADFKFNFLKTFSTYGQFFLDEYNSKEFKKVGWWSKKYAWQLGLKYIDVLKIKNLDYQLEFNQARPFMYSHFTSYTNYTHYNLPLAHPLGANFKEMIMVTRYQPHQKVRLNFTYMYALKGEDVVDKDLKKLNYGGDILLNNRLDRATEYNNVIGQGFQNRIQSYELLGSFMFKHNLFLDLSFQSRTDSYSTAQNETLFNAAIRWNMTRNLMVF
jgi:Capsule assembly protein Wzi